MGAQLGQLLEELSLERQELFGAAALAVLFCPLALPWRCVRRDLELSQLLEQVLEVAETPLERLHAPRSEDENFIFYMRVETIYFAIAKYVN